MEKQISQEQKNEVYSWVDRFDLNQRKTLIQRDFSDGVMLQEILKNYFQKQMSQVQLQSFCSLDKKKQNWEILGRILLGKIGVKLTSDIIDRIVKQEEGLIERVLFQIKKQLEKNHGEIIKQIESQEQNKSMHLQLENFQIGNQKLDNSHYNGHNNGHISTHTGSHLGNNMSKSGVIIKKQVLKENRNNHSVSESQRVIESQAKQIEGLKNTVQMQEQKIHLLMNLLKIQEN